MRRTLARAAVLLAAFGCARKTATTGNPAAPDSVVSFVRTLHHATDDCRVRGVPCLQVDVTYTVLLSVPAGDTLALNRELRRRLNSGTVQDSLPVFADPDSLLAVRIAAFEKPLPNNAPWFDSTYAQVERLLPGALTVSIFNFSYMGGAHPNTTRVYAVLDPATAQEVPLDSVLVPGARPQLLAAAEKAFRAGRGMTPDSSFANAGFWFKEGFELTPNWGFVKDGLLLHYNSYEVAPYSMGPTDALVPWATLAGIVRPRFLPAPS
jgi:hypothetical protein